MESLLLNLYNIDKEISEKISICSNVSDEDFCKKFLRWTMKFLEITGHGIPWLLISGFFAYSSGFSGRIGEFYVNLFSAMIFDLIVVGALKVLIQRKRPVYNADDMFATVKIDQFSFPSGHSTRGMLVAVLFAYILQDQAHIIILYMWALILAFSRIVLGRHHVSDVLAGILIGIIEALAVVNFLWIDEKSIDLIIGNVAKVFKN